MKAPRPHRLLRPLAALVVLGAALPAQDPAALDAARRVDALVERGLAAVQRRPNPDVDDATFARRAYLTIAGRTPTFAELQAFLRGGDGRSREALVDALLESPARVSHDFNQWADVLRVKSRLMRRISGEPYAHFLKDALARNVRYDDLVRQLLAAEGPAHERGNGATGYWLRDLGMPLDAMANTMRVFLGTRMECAQCHDHPFERWTQREFYELAAFTSGMRYSTIDPRSPEQRELLATAREMRQEFGDAGRRALRRLFQDMAVGVAGGGIGAIRLPDDYAYDDAAPSEVVRAHAPFGAQPRLPETRLPRDRRPAARRNARRLPPLRLPDVGSRAAFADWVTSPDNPRFTTVIVNRMWKQVFGVGLIEPIDDLKDDTEACNPELLTWLEQLMRELDYDLVAFRRVLLYTDTFGQEAGTWDADAAEPYRFEGPLLRRMSAEQLWDSLLTLGIEDPDATLGEPGARAEPIYARYDELAGLEGDALREVVERDSLRYSDPQAYRRMRAEELARERAARQSVTREMRQEGRRLLGELREARQKGDQRRALEIVVELRRLRERAAAGRRGRTDLVRASELPAPAPPGHFVREWGQSDREQIASSTTDATIPQALQLLNGVVDGKLLRPGSALMRTLDARKTPDDRIETAFWAVLGRAPSASERAEWRRDFARDADALADLVWTLVNSHEFRFVQ